MHAYATVGWEELFLAEAGASAALAGLLFVAISINLTKILEVRGLVGRAGEAIVLLVAVLVVSTLVLVPDQARIALGSELLVTGLLAWSILVVIHVRAVRGRVGPSHPRARRSGRDGPGGRPPVPGRRGLTAAAGRWRALLAGSRGRLVLGGRGAQCMGAAYRDRAVRPSSVERRVIGAPDRPTTRSVGWCSTSRAYWRVLSWHP
jgi:hypothetical protein